MKANKRTTFYPEREVQKVLAKAEPKKVSERINELILKGISKEREEKIRGCYEKYSLELSLSEPRKKDKHGVSTTSIMASGLFASEDEPDDWF
jgi:hypothetical protein